MGAIEKAMKSEFSPLALNVLNDNGNYLCPCCGLSGQFSAPPYEARGGIIGSGICGACLWEPGFDDDPLASAVAEPTVLGSLLSYRAEWIAAGSLWLTTTKHKRPEGWSAQVTLNNLCLRAAHLFELEN
jgi:hypothetical protein